MTSDRPASVWLAIWILTVAQAYLPVALAQQTVPAIAGAQENSWLLIESKQTTRSIPGDVDDFAPTVQHVRQYFRLSNGGESILLEQDDTGAKLSSQLMNDGRYYLITLDDTKTESCHLDHRHDHTAVFPWRHAPSDGLHRWADQIGGRSKSARGQGSEEAQVAGLVGLWLNLRRDKRTRCQFIDKQREKLACSAKSESGSLKYEIVFEVDSSGQGRPIKAELVRAHSVHIDQSTVLQQVTVAAEIRAFRTLERREAGEIQERFERLLALCKRPGTQLFPSLLKSVAESEQRCYHFAYSVNLYEPPEAPGRRQVQLSKQNVQEWFSYERATQTIARSFERLNNKTNSAAGLEGEKYLRVFGVMQEASVNYQVSFSSDARELFRCQFGSLDGDTSLAAGSKLLRRPMLFHKHAEEGHYRGELIGLGALLMNIADIHHKRADGFRQEVRLGPRNSYQAYVQWQVDDFADTGQRWLLYFRKPTLKQLANHESSIGDLSRVELRHRIATKPRESDRESGDVSGEPRTDFFYGLVMEIEVNDFANSLYQDELDRAFRVPPICPAAEDLEANSSVAGDELQINVPSQEEDECEGGPEDAIGFPSFEQLLGLDQNYKISSRWRFLTLDLNVDTELRVTEYLDMEVQWLDDSSQQVERSLFSRLDVAFVEPESGSEQDRTRYFLYHSINLLMMCRDSEERCTQIYSIDPWLLVMSSEMRLQFDSIPVERASERLRLLGVAALWSLASDTDLTEPRPTAEAGKFAWQLEGESSGLFDGSTKLLLNFQAKNHTQIAPSRGSISVPQPTLSSLTVESNKFSEFTKSGSRLLEVDGIVVQPNAAVAKDFDLPDYCRETQNFSDLNRAVKPLLSTDPSERRADFLTLQRSLGLDDEADQRSRLPHLSFKLSYELIVSASHEGLLERRFRVTEMNSPHLARGLIRLEMQDGGNETLHIWSLENDVKLLENVGHSLCKQAPDLANMFGLSQHLGMIQGKTGQDCGMDFLLAHLWDVFGQRVMDLDGSGKESQLIMSKQSAMIGREQLNTIRWSLFDSNSNLIVFEFIEPAEAGQPGARLKLHSIWMNAAERAKTASLRFMLEASEKLEPGDESRLSLSPPCEMASRDEVKFPLFSAWLDRDERMHMRSELVVSERQIEGEGGEERQKKRIYMLDEWLQSGRAYRAKLFTVGGPDEIEARLEADYLLDLVSDEYFDLSQVGHCKLSPVSGDCGLDYVPDETIRSLALIPEAQMISHLFHSKAVIFYGPICVWMLAEYLKQTPPSRSSLHVLDLFDSTRVDRWFATSFWSLQHPQSGALRMDLSFKRMEDVGRHSMVLRSIVSNNWRAKSETSTESISVEIVNYHFHSRASPSEAEAIFRVPKGFGCKRNARAKRAFSMKDVIVFNELSPLEFEYEASMSAVPARDNASSQLEPLSVIQSGWFGKCPSTWNSMLIGALRVNRQERHFTNGTRDSWLRVAARDVGASKTITRTLDEATGSCRIGHLSSTSALERSQNEHEILVLEFASEQIRLSSALFAAFERSAEAYERIQEFSDTLPDGTVTSRAVYEAYHKELELNERLKGEGFVIKTFHREPARTKTFHIYNYHTEMELEVIIPKRAHLKLRVSNLQFGECFDIIRAARAQQCFMDDEDSASTSADQWVSHAHLQHHFEAQTKHTQRLRSFELTFEAQDGQHVTSEQFISEKPHLERALMRILLSSPGQIPAMQLGDFRLLFEERDSSIRAHLNLLEPVSLRHSFNMLAGQTLKQLPREAGANGAEVIGHLATTSSLGKCADLCEKQQRNQAGRRLCVAFSYCRDRSCQTLLGPSKKLSESYANWVAPNLQADTNCQVFYGDFLELASSRRNIDDLLESVRQQQEGGALLSNKYVLNLRLENNLTVRYIGSQLDEVTANEKESAWDDGLAGSSWGQFALHSRQSDLELAFLNEKYSHLGAKLLITDSLQSCMLACTSAAGSLISYCDSTKVCTIIADITTWDDYRDTLNQAIRERQKSCSVYSHNFLNNFELFEATQEPKEHAKKAVNFSLEQCAAYCQLQQDELPADCLSFDFCLSPSEPSVCYLQTTHLIMDNFDESILEQRDPSIIKAQLDGKWRGLEKPRFCSHYSRSLVADFERKERSQLVEHKSIVFQGTQLEQCALICRRDETCLAFEYCHLKASRVNTCYLERSRATPDENEPAERVADQLGPLKGSDECSVYELKKEHLREEKALPQQLELNLASLNSSSRQEALAPSARSRFGLPVLVSLCAMLAGLMLGIVCARMTRKPALNRTGRRPSARL